MHVSKVFDTYKSPESFDHFVKQGVPDGYIVIAACKDDCVTKLSQKGKTWFANMGSKEIWKVQYRYGWAFIGINGKKEPMEKRSIFGSEQAYATQIFQLSVTLADPAEIAMELEESDDQSNAGNEDGGGETETPGVDPLFAALDSNKELQD